MIFLICGILKSNELNKTETVIDKVVTRGEQEEEIQGLRDTKFHFKQMSHEQQMYSLGIESITNLFVW